MKRAQQSHQVMSDEIRDYFPLQDDQAVLDGVARLLAEFPQWIPERGDRVIFKTFGPGRRPYGMPGVFIRMFDPEIDRDDDEGDWLPSVRVAMVKFDGWEYLQRIEISSLVDDEDYEYQCPRCGASFSLPPGMECDDHYPVLTKQALS